MSSLRQYLTLTELAERRPNITEPDEGVLMQAEQDIDKAIASFYEGGWRKSVISIYTLQDVAINGATATCPSLNSGEGYFARCILQVMSGDNAGKSFFISTSNGQTITLAESSGLNETVVANLFQLAKFPSVNDTYSANSVTYKVIPEFIKEAVAYQYEFRIDNAGSLNNKYAATGYSVSQDSFAENFNPKMNASVRERISPQAWDLISHLTTTSL